MPVTPPHALLAAMAAMAAAQPADFVRDEETPQLAFHYGWPAEADSIPGLRARLRADMARDRDRARRYVAEGRNLARRNRTDFTPHDYSKNWAVAGSNAALLSLTAEMGGYTGGAHPNSGFGALLWDRRAGAPAAASGLIGGEVLDRMSPRFCAALDARRAEKRGEPVRPDPTDPFSACPRLAELVIAPADRDGNGRFETLRVLMPPYVAGPYVEGDYVVETAFDAEDVGGIAEAFRSAFEAVRP